MSEKGYQAVELANKSGKIKKGVNEVTKVVEKGQAKLVLFAGDVSPKEIVMHLPMICKEKKVPCIEVPSRAELGAAAGLPVGTVAVAIVEAGDAKDLIKEFGNQ
ncbi:MAG: ribosomal L7Ae/L30e/S12e/Gadd45 family protein [Candidatus Woesearchaeota archaeon]